MINLEILIEESRLLFPEYIYEHIKFVNKHDPEEFERQYIKAKNNSKRKGFGNSKYNLWIAANLTDVRIRSRLKPQQFSCYYCYTDLSLLPPEEVIFEHYIPKLHIPENIVSACNNCDKFKLDRMPEEFENIILNEELVKNDRYVKTKTSQEKLLHFAPLVACRSMQFDLWVDKMIEIADKYFNEDLSVLHRGQVRWSYYPLYRKRWNKN